MTVLKNLFPAWLVAILLALSPAALSGAPAKFIGNLANGVPQKIVFYGTSLTANGAWTTQLQTAVAARYPGTATWVNSGGSGKASDWGVANLQTKVINHNPDAVLIEFSMNDAATTLNISRAQARANLKTMVDAILASRPGCEIILQMMNPVDRQPGDTLSPRPELELYQQDYRDFAAARGLLCIDHMPAWQALFDKGTTGYRVHVPDGVHPTADGLSLFMTPVLLQALGVPQGGAPVVRLRMDNRRMAEPTAPGGQARVSSLIVWLPEAAAVPTTVFFDTAGSTATAGADYQPLPASLTIPAGQLSASVQVVPLHDGAGEPEESFRVKALPNAAYTLSSPIEATVIIEASALPPAVPSGPLIIEENFGGPATGLNGTGADTFDPALITSGGSATWLAGASFLANGTIVSDTAQTSASLNLGGYLNGRKGLTDGKFILTATLSETTNTWISLGFSQLNVPATNQNFTNASASGVATVIYRAQNASPPGELDMLPVLNSTPIIDGPDGNTGPRTLSVTLDLTPAGGYNGTNHHGTVTWSDSVLGVIGTHTFTAAVNFGAILLTEGNTTTATVSKLSLIQVFPTPPAHTFANWLAARPPATGFGIDSDMDGIPNGLEHVFGNNPNVNDSGIRELVSTHTSLAFRHPLNPDLASDVSYDYQWSTNLSDWHASGDDGGGGVIVTITPSAPDATGMVTVAVEVTAGSSRGLFARIRAENQ